MLSVDIYFTYLLKFQILNHQLWIGKRRMGRPATRLTDDLFKAAGWQ